MLLDLAWNIAFLAALRDGATIDAAEHAANGVRWHRTKRTACWIRGPR